MSEVIYSKKQLKPIIDKFGINPTEDETFKEIITMFPEQTNYHIWALKALYSKKANMEDIKQIKGWADKNPTHIKMLIKGNIVSYNNVNDFKNLFKEMQGIDMINAVKNSINKFNTAQRAMLNSYIFAFTKADGSKEEINGLLVVNSTYFKSKYDILKQFETINENRKATFITKASAYTNVLDLWKGITDCLQASYAWDKEDMLNFVQRNTKDVKIVYDNGPIVILQIPNFEASHKICGSGRTGWCITRDKSYFNQYVVEPKGNKQYFFFDFSKRENDELAHVGFTVSPTNGICNAHSTHNNNMIGSGIKYNKEQINVQKLLEMNGIKPSVYIRLKDMKRYKWSMESILDFLNAHKNLYAIAINKNNHLVISCLSHDAIALLCEHTFINLSNVVTDGNAKTYVFIDLNTESNDNKSLILINCNKDRYGTYSISRIIDAFNAYLPDDSYLAKIGIKQEDYIGKEKIPSSILLHKYIEENRENDAIALIASNPSDLDINFEFEFQTPINSAIQKGMLNLFSTLINNPKFDANQLDIFTENVITSLLYEYLGRTECEPDNKEGIAKCREMINIALDSKNMDFNIQNVNKDTAINVACSNPSLNWVVAKLVANPNVNINVINDFNCGALGCAIQSRNVDAIKLLSQRSDFVVRDTDAEFATELQFNLSEVLEECKSIAC